MLLNQATTGWPCIRRALDQTDEAPPRVKATFTRNSQQFKRFLPFHPDNVCGKRPSDVTKTPLGLSNLNTSKMYNVILQFLTLQ